MYFYAYCQKERDSIKISKLTFDKINYFTLRNQSIQANQLIYDRSKNILERIRGNGYRQVRIPLEINGTSSNEGMFYFTKFFIIINYSDF
jgi:hypothetical protein